MTISWHKTKVILFHYEYLLSSFLGRLDAIHECSVTERQTADTGRQLVLRLRIASRGKKYFTSVAIYQVRRQNKSRCCSADHSTCRNDHSTDSCMALPACNYSVLLDASWYKTSVTLFHCWCLLTSLSKWTACCDLDQCAVPPSSIHFHMSYSDSHWRVNLKYAASGCCWFTVENHTLAR